MPEWKTNGVRVVRAGELDTNVTHSKTGASKLRPGTVKVDPAAKTAAHHHDDLETVRFIIQGRARMRRGEYLEFSEEAGPSDFIFLPPWVPHQEMNARTDEPVEAVVIRSGQYSIVMNPADAQ